MRDYCDKLKDEAAAFAEYASLHHVDINSYHTTEGFKGVTAREAKKFVKSGVGNMLKGVSYTQEQMEKAQTEAITMFEQMVDPAQNARIEYDTLELINNDFKEMYFIFRDSAARVKKIVDCLNEEFGSYAYFE